jgi:iron(II)-dependent oxidoreductase
MHTDFHPIRRNRILLILLFSWFSSLSLNEADFDRMAFIPSGWFLLGSEEGNMDEKPVHPVRLDGFYLDRTEVTVAQFRKFCESTGREMITQPNWSRDDHPVVNVSYDDSIAYAQWAGKRLPSEAEWEYAARGGFVQKKFPWGDQEPDGNRGNFADKNIDLRWADKGADDKNPYTSPVGIYPPNGYGLYDMDGNVSEWCSDWYSDHYYTVSPKQNPQGPVSGSLHVIRGGSWFDYSWFSRCAHRINVRSEARGFFYGFRCAKDA